jgi:formate/nitrite transporter FocA (FNT family)
MLENLYPHLNAFHGVFRWLVLVFALVAIVIAFSGWRSGKSVSPFLFPFGLSYVLAMDLELITGVLLYLGASPNLRSAFTVHGVVMFLAVLCAHIGGAATRKAPSDTSKHRVSAIAWVISLLLIFAAIPRH